MSPRDYSHATVKRTIGSCPHKDLIRPHTATLAKWAYKELMMTLYGPYKIATEIDFNHLKSLLNTPNTPHSMIE